MPLQKRPVYYRKWAGRGTDAYFGRVSAAYAIVAHAPDVGAGGCAGLVVEMVRVGQPGHVEPRNDRGEVVAARIRIEKTYVEERGERCQAGNSAKWRTRITESDANRARQ
jgi:hypothetical protein